MSTRRRLRDEQRAAGRRCRGNGRRARGSSARRRASRRRRRAAARGGPARCRPAPWCCRSAPRRSTSSEVRRRRFFGLFGSQAPQPSAGRGTPMEEPQPRMVKRKVMRPPPAGRGTLLNRRKKLSVVCRAISSSDTPRDFGQHPGGLGHIGRLVALAADICRARDRARRSRPGCGRPADPWRWRAGRRTS